MAIGLIAEPIEIVIPVEIPVVEETAWRTEQGDSEDLRPETVSSITLAENSQPERNLTYWDCSCVTYMRELGHDFPRIPNPSFLQANSPPFVGGLILIQYGNLSHIGEIADLRPGGVIYRDRRLINGKCITSMRWIAFDNPGLRGFRRP